MFPLQSSLFCLRSEIVHSCHLLSLCIWGTYFFCMLLNMWKSNHKIFIFVHVCQISRYPACVHFVDPTSSWSLLCAVLVDNSSAVYKCWIMTYYFSQIGLFHTCTIHCFSCCVRRLFVWMTIWSFTDMQIPHYAVIITSVNCDGRNMLCLEKPSHIMNFFVGSSNFPVALPLDSNLSSDWLTLVPSVLWSSHKCYILFRTKVLD